MKLREMILSAFFIALVFVATYLVQIPFPIALGTGGLIHLGNVVAFSIAIKYGPKHGALAGGIGMALFDLFSLWTIWAPGTFIVRFMAGAVIGHVANASSGQGESIKRNVFAIFLGAIVIIVGYFIYEAFFLGVGIAAFGSVIGNIVQIIIGLIALFLVPLLPAKNTLDHAL